MAENLSVDTFRNGDPIPEAKTDEEWEEADENGEPAWLKSSKTTRLLQLRMARI